jgi:pyruvate kinase
MNDTAMPAVADTVAGTAADASRRHRLEEVVAQLTQLRGEMHDLAVQDERRIGGVDADFRDSAANLLHYVALRRHDLRDLQDALARLGLSSLGRAEAHVMASVEAALTTARAALGQAERAPASAAIGFDQGQQLLQQHTEALLGAPPSGRSARIMVTMPAEAASDYGLVHELLRKGMDCMRINCAHDDAAVWKAIIDHLRRAEGETGRRCRVLMDLGGPKLRTGPLQSGPAVVKVRPQRDVYGRVLRPARLWLTASERPQPPPAGIDASIPVAAGWLAQLAARDEIRLHDARGASRRWTVVTVAEGGCIAEAGKSCYLVPRLLLQRVDGDGHPRRAAARIGPLPAREGFIELSKGDLLLLRGDTQPGHAAKLDRRGRVVAPAVIACTLPAVLDDLRVGEPIWFDDGHIGGLIEDLADGCAKVRITHAGKGRARLRSDKGINLPSSRLRTPALTPKDLADLAFVAEHADMVGLSFVSRSEDVLALQSALDRLPGRKPAIVLKVETRRAFQYLPRLLLTAMRRSPCGVMIARGDLAVECGFERLAEVQEELLWLCEAAHVPVIWATEVLDSLARTGLPSRAEITDAAMAHRAECVMLNKGPHIVEALEALDDILQRMQGHQSKKTARLRTLQLASEFDSGRGSSLDRP